MPPPRPWSSRRPARTWWHDEPVAHRHRRAGHQRPRSRRHSAGHRRGRCRRHRRSPDRLGRPARGRPRRRRRPRPRRPRGRSRLRGLPLPPGLRRRPGAGVRGPDGGGELRRRRHPHHRRRDASRDRRAAGRQRGAARGGDAAAGHHHRGDQERLRADRPRRGARPGHRPAVHRRDHLPRRPRGAAGVRRRPRRLRRPRHRPDARRRRAVREVDRRVLRDGRLRRRPGPRDPGGRVGRTDWAAGCTPTSSVPVPAYDWPASSA